MKGTHLATHCVARGLAPTAKNHLGPHWPLKCHLIAKHENYVAMHVLAMQHLSAHPAPVAGNGKSNAPKCHLQNVEIVWPWHCTC